MQSRSDRALPRQAQLVLRHDPLHVEQQLSARSSVFMTSRRLEREGETGESPTPAPAARRPYRLQACAHHLQPPARIVHGRSSSRAGGAGERRYTYPFLVRGLEVVVARHSRGGWVKEAAHGFHGVPFPHAHCLAAVRGGERVNELEAVGQSGRCGLGGYPELRGGRRSHG